MNITWNQKWKTVLIWVSAYLNFIAFVLVGGFFYVRKENEELQTATKHAFITTLIFAAISALLSVYNYLGGLADGYYSSAAYEVYSVFTAIVAIAKIVTFAVFVILALVKKDGPVDPVIDGQRETDNR